MEGVFFQTSLVAAFVAGMVALFAPCCITFLLPAYLGSVFKEKQKVMLMTLVFGAGIFIVLLPAVLGVALISRALFRYHDLIYTLGGLVMVGVAITTFLGLKLPMPNLPSANIGGRTDVVSIFVLGVFSGITSACCAPVLIGILALTFLSPSFWGAILIGAIYVLGMVVPLLLISLLVSDKLPRFTVLRKPVMTFKILDKSYVVILSNLVASLVFMITGLAALVLTATGKLSMENMDKFTEVIKKAGEMVNSLVGGNVLADVLLVLAVVFLIYGVSKKM